MRFKEWLIKEIGTSTGDVAGFKRISIPMTRRMWPPEVATMFANDPPGKKKKKIKTQPQLEEGWKNTLGTAALLGASAFAGGCNGPECPTPSDMPQSNSQVQNIDIMTAIKHGQDIQINDRAYVRNGSLYVVHMDKARKNPVFRQHQGKILATKARAELMQLLGKNSLRGISDTIKQKEGTIAAVVSWSPDQAEMARQAAQQMGN